MRLPRAIPAPGCPAGSSPTDRLTAPVQADSPWNAAPGRIPRTLFQAAVGAWIPASSRGGTRGSSGSGLQQNSSSCEGRGCLKSLCLEKRKCWKRPLEYSPGPAAVDSVWRAGLVYCLLSGKEGKALFVSVLGTRILVFFSPNRSKTAGFSLIHEISPPKPLRNPSPHGNHLLPLENWDAEASLDWFEPPEGAEISS